MNVLPLRGEITLDWQHHELPGDAHSHTFQVGSLLLTIHQDVDGRVTGEIQDVQIGQYNGFDENHLPNATCGSMGGLLRRVLVHALAQRN